MVFARTLLKTLESKDSVLNKPAKLTREEYISIQQHPVIGFDMLKLIESFGVVAEEIRKLAATSKDSIDKISAFLASIQSKYNQVRGMISKVSGASVSSSETTDKVKSAFTQISSNTVDLFEQVKIINKLIKELQKSSSGITNEVANISAATEQNAASVEEILCSLNEQNQRITNVSSSFNEIYGLITDLEAINS